MNHSLEQFNVNRIEILLHVTPVHEERPVKSKKAKTIGVVLFEPFWD